MNLKYTLHIISGPKKGSFFNIKTQKLSLGRNNDSDVTLDFDPSCSRKHAVIEAHANGSIIIYNISNNNKITVNNKNIDSKTALKHLDNFIIGKTTFKIEIPNLLQAQPNSSEQGFNDNHFSASASASASAKKNSYKKPLVIAGVLMLMLFILLPAKKEKKKKAFTSFQNIEKEIASIQEQTTTLYKQQQQDRVRDQLYKKAQIFYLSGFREYRQGKYQNASSSFQACLSLIPDHKLCNRYIILARRKFLELVQYHILLGQKYLKQHQNKSCKTAFRNVMIMLNNKNNNTYKEAKVNFQLCALRLKGQY
ncbi:MAG: FHA domain-containing protein [Bdellovibrionaceae bacterium]|nr:FHA domain-containing protein [Pseudobdellovibrionaceae bacterium]